jgi:hypothetical protein
MHIFAVSRRQELKHKSALTGGVISGAAGQNRFAQPGEKVSLFGASRKNHTGCIQNNSTN